MHIEISVIARGEQYSSPFGRSEIEVTFKNADITTKLIETIQNMIPAMIENAIKDYEQTTQKKEEEQRV